MRLHLGPHGNADTHEAMPVDRCCIECDEDSRICCVHQGSLVSPIAGTRSLAQLAARPQHLRLAAQRILGALLQAHRMVLTARPEHTVPSPPLIYGLPRAGVGVKLSGIRPQRTILQPSWSHFSHLAGCCGSDWCSPCPQHRCPLCCSRHQRLRNTRPIRSS